MALDHGLPLAAVGTGTGLGLGFGVAFGAGRGVGFGAALEAVIAGWRDAFGFASALGFAVAAPAVAAPAVAVLTGEGAAVSTTSAAANGDASGSSVPDGTEPVVAPEKAGVTEGASRTRRPSAVAIPAVAAITRVGSGSACWGGRP